MHTLVGSSGSKQLAAFVSSMIKLAEEKGGQRSLLATSIAWYMQA
jgi:hypothetical protein